MIKNLLPKQVVCNEKDEKGKPCHGGLKRYYPMAGYFNEQNEERKARIAEEYGSDKNLVLLKCEACGTVYRLPPVLEEKFR